MQIKTETRVGFFVLIAIGVFFYMTFQIGVFRLGLYQYNSYIVYFEDISGLKKKAEVKIAGVKVGWVDKLDLISDHELSAQLKLMIHKKYVLYENAYAIIRQDGLLGARYIEVEPGDKTVRALPAGSTLDKPGKPPVHIDELMRRTKRIAINIEEVTDSLKQVLAGPERREQLENLIDNMSSAFKSFKEVAPSFQDSMDKIADVFDRDFNRVANKLSATADTIEDAAAQIRQGFKSINSVAEKIDAGQGLLGQLVNDEEVSQDVKKTLEGVKNYFAKADSIGLVFDSHFESMYRPAENFAHEDSKGYIDIRVHPSEDRFYLIQIASTQKGNIERRVFNNIYRDENCDPLDRSTLTAVEQFDFPAEVEETLRYRDTYKFGFQFGKIFKDIAFRFGIFENFFGIGVDYDIPFNNDTFRWVTTLEAFDLSGRDRLNDRRPHLKWLNRLFILDNIYFTFGADDFISRKNANGFFGLGLRFGDEDFKYVASSMKLDGLSSLGGANLRLR